MASDTLDRLLCSLSVRLHAASVCLIQDGWQLAYAPFPGGHGALRAARVRGAESRYAQAIETAGKTPSGDPGKDASVAQEALLTKTPLGVPWIAPEDVAPVVVFLASDAARMVSGATYCVTGGDSASYSA